MADKKEATEKFHKITEAKDALLNQSPEPEAQLSSRQAYEEFKQRQKQTWEESWEDRQRWQREQRERYKQEEEAKNTWRAKPSPTPKAEGNDLLFFSIAAVAGYYMYSMLLQPKEQPKRPVPKQTIHKQAEELGLKDPFSRRLHVNEPIVQHIYTYKGRLGSHTRFLQMTSGPASFDAIFKCTTCNALISKRYIEKHVQTFAYKYSI